MRRCCLPFNMEVKENNTALSGCRFLNFTNLYSRLDTFSRHNQVEGTLPKCNPFPTSFIEISATTNIYVTKVTFRAISTFNNPPKKEITLLKSRQ